MTAAEQMADEIYGLHYEIYGLHCDIGRLEQENARLRELVRDYDKTLELSIVGYDGPDAPLLDAVYISLRSRMYELGVEVTDGGVS